MSILEYFQVLGVAIAVVVFGWITMKCLPTKIRATSADLAFDAASAIRPLCLFLIVFVVSSKIRIYMNDTALDDTWLRLRENGWVSFGLIWVVPLVIFFGIENRFRESAFPANRGVLTWTLVAAVVLCSPAYYIQSANAAGSLEFRLHLPPAAAA